MGYIVSKDNGEVDELARVIDKLMEDGSGRLTVDFSDLQNGVTFTTTKTTDCSASKPNACEQPTELLDEDDE